MSSRTVVAVVVAALTLASCGGGGGGQAASTTSTTAQAATTTTVPPPVEVLSCNMAPGLMAGDRVSVEFAAGKVSAGDIVYFLAPRPVRKGAFDLLMARAVAVGPARVDSRDGKVTIDGKPEHGEYLKPGTRTLGLGPIDVPAGSIFVMGDNRGNSADSRMYGPVPIADVLYRATGKVDRAPERECS